MTGWLTVIGAVLQVVLYLLQSHASKEVEVKQDHADKAKEISDAIASGNISRINNIVMQLRRKT